MPSNTPPQPISAVIITQDAADQLLPCLESLSFASEIVVVDSGSCDGTVALAQERGARVIHQKWLGYGPQKNFAVAQAMHPWVLCLDADERISPALRESLLREMAEPRFQAYELPRCNRFMGRWLRHGEGYPDYVMRLFHRDHARWSEDPIHEHVLAACPVGRLTGDLLHESETTLEEYLTKQNRYTTLQAEQLRQRGKRIGLRHLLVNPIARFVKFYFLRLGFLDGIPGLVHVSIGCFNSFIKYAKAMGRIDPR